MAVSSQASPPARPVSARARKIAFASLAVAGIVGAIALVRLQSAPSSESRPPERGGASAGAAPTGAPSQKPVAGPSSQAPLLVDVHVAKPEPLELTVPATGSLIAHESVDLVSELSRRLIKVQAKEGQPVKKGDVLFQLDTADLNAQVKRLDVQKRLAKLTLERSDKLQAENLVTRQEWEQARAQYDQAEAERAILGVTLAQSTIRAPFSGTLGLRRVSEGAWVTPQIVLATLQDTSRLKIDFTVPERFTTAIKQGQKFTFTVEGHGERMSGTIVAIEPQIVASSRSVLARGLVENHAGLLPGTFARVEVPLSADDALLVPSIAVIPSVKGRSVYVVREGKAQLVDVKTGARTPDRVQILTGITAGDQVIVTNLLRLRDGAPVKVNTP
ncbi:efflux RND transporter periplasmic adaptor subunit [Chondromyces crocatus]|uniref:MexH family multidrug efflux RND transporter periplasmic adaptor subunit n=1 Tax=Chondromyces crocatus TaxID=52 RepID=A0A0K1E7V8_CHOCO|nr:efflux RND transporter periplasmic adaptor subunit [Chondromyces crocatus]AKT36950.1 MexH family multidrug efflux RND transporter periplasmic adaptor subunit [Chondromyces crocatus]